MNKEYFQAYLRMGRGAYYTTPMPDNLIKITDKDGYVIYIAPDGIYNVIAMDEKEFDEMYSLEHHEIRP